MAQEYDKLELGITKRLATLVTADWPIVGISPNFDLEPESDEAYQTWSIIPNVNQNQSIGDGACTLLTGTLQINFFLPRSQGADVLSQRIDTVSDAFWVNRGSVDIAESPFIIRFRRKPSRMPGLPRSTMRTASLDIEYSMRSKES